MRINTRSNNIAYYLLAIFFLTTVGCSHISSVLQSPRVKVINVRPIKLGLSEQIFRFTLNVHNPNAFGLPIRGVEFSARFSGVDVGTGINHSSTSIPSAGSKDLEIDVKTQLAKSIGDFSRLFNVKGLNFDYQLNGKVKLVESYLEVPFQVNGNALSRK